MIPQRKNEFRLPVQITENAETVEELESSFQDLEPEINHISDESDTNSSIVENDDDQNLGPAETSTSLISALTHMEAIFCLKMTAKDMLAINVVNDILEYCNAVHASKLKVITTLLKKDYSDDNEINIDKVIQDIVLMDNCIGLKDRIETHFKREKYLKTKFSFIEPERMVIKTIENECFFYYQIPIRKTLNRLLEENTLRKFIINQPNFVNRGDVSDILLIFGAMVRADDTYKKNIAS